MAYYGSNVNAKLYIGASTATTLPVPASDTFTEVPLVGQITPPSNEISAAFFSILNDAVRRSVGGRAGDKTAECNLIVDWTLTPHQNIFADSIVAGGQKRNWRIIYPDAGARQLDFVAFVSSWKEEAFDASEDGKEHRANFGLTVDGGVTVTP